MEQKKILLVFGTRPEAIKMAPLVKELEKYPEFEVVVAVTAQHREMLDQVLSLFNITPKYDLNIMKTKQSLGQITINALSGLEEVIMTEKPDIVLVHGDTTTTFVAGLAAFYNKVKVGHVEAGLRTHNKWLPYPEEINRKLAGTLSDIHFAPTKVSMENLIRENVPREKIVVTGNTVIDALMETLKKEYAPPSYLADIDFKEKKVVTVTCHRRENQGQTMENIFEVIKNLAVNNQDIEVVFPVHKNPVIQELANKILGGVDRVHLVDALEYFDFANLEKNSYIIVTDSGGVQEEAPALGVPVVVMRDVTERPDALAAGTVKLGGTKPEDIYAIVQELLDNKELYQSMSRAINPYGDGHSCERIARYLLYFFGFTKDKPEEFGI